LSPSSAASYLELARLYRGGGRESKALEMYRKTLEWDPTNKEAREAVEARKESAVGGGLLRSIFKKD
jgi:tetratricopeptide (TPR) repeat protein